MRFRMLVAVMAVVVTLAFSVAVYAAPAELPNCSFYPVQGFGQLWFTGERIASLLRCPTTVEYGVWVAEQRFQYGQAIWFSDSNTVFVLLGGGTVYPFTGVGSINQVYNAYPWVRARLGYATEDARGVTASWQDFQRGAMYWTHKSGRIVFFRGWWERY